MNSWEKFLPAITATPGSGHQEKHWQRLVGAEPFISTGLELSLSIRIMMNPSPVSRKRKILLVSPSHHRLLDGPRTGLVGTMPLLQPWPCESPRILSSGRDRRHYPGQVETVIIICLAIFFFKKQFPPSASVTELGKYLSDPSTVFSSPREDVLSDHASPAILLYTKSPVRSRSFTAASNERRLPLPSAASTPARDASIRAEPVGAGDPLPCQ